MLDNAAGLRQRSPVMIGGVQAGTVSLHLGAGDQVIAQLNLDRSHAPVGKDASVAISAVNFLGQKQAELSPGNASDPAPSGYLIPASRITTSTDLDQVLNVLDANTRARLAIMVDEAGTALTGRRADFSQVLEQLPHALPDATALLNQLVGDNHTLAHVVATGNQFLGAVAAQRGQLTRMIDAVGQTAVSVAARRAQLAQTLARTPGTLATLQGFLGKLQATTIPLGPAARNIATTAPFLTATLAQVDPFRTVADPTLRTATALAPELTQLATGATPVVTSANPVVASLASFSTALKPVSETLNHSVDNLLAVVENWSRAIQFRDGLSHVFRGEAAITPEVLKSVIDRMTKTSAKVRHQSARVQQPQAAQPQPSGAQAPAPRPTNAAPPNVASTVNGLLQQVVGRVTGNPSTTAQPATPVGSLLKYLLGP
jgi:phospholipid/cholesterol/gamma-HCH transport system substrate-binding protein